MFNWQTSFVRDVVDQTSNTKSFLLEVPGAEAFNFLPGQFVTLDLPIHERPSQRLRSYSIASWPNGSNLFELLISHKIGGTGSTYLFDAGKPGHEIKFRGPLGTFTLPETFERDVCMICTGTGIAPFRSQLRYMADRKFPENEIHLVFGTRHESDILYFDEFRNLEKRFPNFHYHVALSRENGTSWNGHKGYVHEIYEAIAEGGKKDMDFYLCGWRNMISEARERIHQMGYHTDRVHLESYD